MDAEEGKPFPKKKKLRGGAGRAVRRAVRRRLPVAAWARRYDREDALADLVAGVTLGLTLVPQSIAYAALANLPVHYGLYSSFVGTMLYVFLGTVKEVSIGPTSLMALLTLQYCRGLPIEFMVLLTFLSGCVVLLMGLLRLGFLVDLISPSVTSGFTSGTTVIIVVAQLKGLLGLSFTAESLLENVLYISSRWDQVRRPDCLLSLACCTVLLTLRKLKDVKVNPKRSTLKKTLWFISISRNAFVVFASAAYAYCVHDPKRPLFKLSGTVEAGLPTLEPPPFSVAAANGTVTVTFLEMVQQLSSGVIMLPVVMVLANIAIAKAFATGGRVDATQEMLTLGVCNVAGSLVHAMPTCGAFTRSAVSHASGVRTPAAGLYSGIIALLALNFMTQYFYYIPKACLSSVLICAVIFMIDIPIVGRLWRSSKSELTLLVLTFAVSVGWSVEMGVLAGALANLAGLLRALTRPKIHLHTVKYSGGEVCRLRPTVALVYVNAEHFAARLHAAASASGSHSHAPLLVDCSSLSLIDYVAAQTLERLIEKYKRVGRQLIFYNASKEALQKLEKLESVDKRALGATSVQEALAATEELAGEAGGAPEGAGGADGRLVAQHTAPLLNA